LRLRAQKEFVMELVCNSVKCRHDKVERLCHKKHR
jgi:hypothetical protein